MLFRSIPFFANFITLLREDTIKEDLDLNGTWRAVQCLRPFITRNNIISRFFQFISFYLF